MNAWATFLRVIAMTAALLVSLVVLLAAAPASAVGVEKEFCWKDTYGRGAGKVPESCKADEDRIGLLCYKKCESGMKRFGFDCHSVCPDGFRDDGLFCRKAEYGRGAGFAWQFGDALNDSGMKRRCENQHGVGNCEKHGAIFYPKCKPGYSPVGCCICRPAVPNCPQLGLNPGVDLSCAKKVEIGRPVTGQCSAGQQQDAGLCYDACGSGYDGVGPVCWGKAPKQVGTPPRDWVDCGMGAAKDSSACQAVVTDQVTAVGEIALFVATVGSGAAAAQATKAKKLAGINKLKTAWNALSKAQKGALVVTAGNKGIGIIRNATEIDNSLDNATTEEDYARVAALIAALADPTGVSSTVAAYTYPKCSKYFGPPR